MENTGTFAKHKAEKNLEERIVNQIRLLLEKELGAIRLKIAEEMVPKQEITEMSKRIDAAELAMTELNTQIKMFIAMSSIAAGGIGSLVTTLILRGIQ